MNWTQEQNKNDMKEYEYNSSLPHLHVSVISKPQRVSSQNDAWKSITIWSTNKASLDKITWIICHENFCNIILYFITL